MSRVISDKKEMMHKKCQLLFFLYDNKEYCGSSLELASTELPRPSCCIPNAGACTEMPQRYLFNYHVFDLIFK